MDSNETPFDISLEKLKVYFVGDGSQTDIGPSGAESKLPDICVGIIGYSLE